MVDRLPQPVDHVAMIYVDGECIGDTPIVRHVRATTVSQTQALDVTVAEDRETAVTLAWP